MDDMYKYFICSVLVGKVHDTAILVGEHMFCVVDGASKSKIRWTYTFLLASLVGMSYTDLSWDQGCCNNIIDRTRCDVLEALAVVTVQPEIEKLDAGTFLSGGPPDPLPEGPPPPPGMYGGNKAGPLPFLLKPVNWLPMVAVPAKVSADIVCDISEW